MVASGRKMKENNSSNIKFWNDDIDNTHGILEGWGVQDFGISEGQEGYDSHAVHGVVWIFSGTTHSHSFAILH